jgi:3-hydroxybutyryl-CoA dehydratase
MAALQVGREWRSAPRRMTRERMRWYCDAHDTVICNDGKFHIAPPNIHNDDDFAKGQGLAAIIADGMISTNWLYGFVLDTFGETFLRRGALRTKYVRPVHEDQPVVSCARVKELRGEACILEVWCEDDTGHVLTVGEATVYVQADGAR